MSCYAPISVRQATGFVMVPCGICAGCLQKKRSDWTFRLLQEVKNASSASFWTFTYNEERFPFGIPGCKYYDKKEKKVIQWETEKFGRGIKNVYDGVIPICWKKDVQDFLKRLRRKQERMYKNKAKALVKKYWYVKWQKLCYENRIKYFLCAEYGEKTMRPHYHAIIFNLDRDLYQFVEGIWKNGYIYVGDVTQASIHYTTKYMLKSLSGYFRTWALMSKNLGASYLTEKIKYYHNDFTDGEEKDFITYEGGYKNSMPRYYREKIFSSKRREEMRKKYLIESKSTKQDSQSYKKTMTNRVYKQLKEGKL